MMRTTNVNMSCLLTWIDNSLTNPSLKAIMHSFQSSGRNIVDILEVANAAPHLEVCIVLLSKLAKAFNKTLLGKGVADTDIRSILKDHLCDPANQSDSSLSSFRTPAVLSINNLHLVILQDTALESVSSKCALP